MSPADPIWVSYFIVRWWLFVPLSTSQSRCRRARLSPRHCRLYPLAFFSFCSLQLTTLDADDSFILSFHPVFVLCTLYLHSQLNHPQVPAIACSAVCLLLVSSFNFTFRFAAIFHISLLPYIRYRRVVVSHVLHTLDFFLATHVASSSRIQFLLLFSSLLTFRILA